MGLKEKIYSFAAGLFFERPARGKSFTELAQQLGTAGEKVLARLEGKSNSERNHQVLTHIIGIERWGQSRLRVLLGDPLRQEEYLVYRPARDVPWNELVENFRTTRAETVSLAQALKNASVAPEQSVPHNQFGPISARAWLGYLQAHASREIMQVR
ncbi:MAG: hypothetical protein KF753_22820 [Caldilineaceae bacterium]|nr:hypothetical protein [Caldilineaceae bacterium]